MLTNTNCIVSSIAPNSNKNSLLPRFLEETDRQRGNPVIYPGLLHLALLRCFYPVF